MDENQTESGDEIDLEADAVIKHHIKKSKCIRTYGQYDTGADYWLKLCVFRCVVFIRLEATGYVINLA